MLFERYSQEVAASDDSPPRVRRRYETYTAEYRERKLKDLFNKHKEEEWFVDRYSRSAFSIVVSPGSVKNTTRRA